MASDMDGGVGARIHITRKANRLTIERPADEEVVFELRERGASRMLPVAPTFATDVYGTVELHYYEHLGSRQIAEGDHEGDIQVERPKRERTIAPNFGIVGASAAIMEVLADLSTIAAGSTNVLVLGESGTGKELIARAI